MDYATFPHAPTYHPPRNLRHRVYPYALTIIYLLLESILIFTLYTLLATPVDPDQKPILTFVSSVLYFSILIVTDTLLAYRYRRNMQVHRAEVERRVRNVIDAIKTEVGFRDDFCRLLRKEMERCEVMEKQIERLKACGVVVDLPPNGCVVANSSEAAMVAYNGTTKSYHSSQSSALISATNTETADSELERSQASTILTRRHQIPGQFNTVPISPRGQRPLVPGTIVLSSRMNASQLHVPESDASPFTQQFGEQPAPLPAYVAQLRSQMLGDLEQCPRPFGDDINPGRAADMCVVGEIFQSRIGREERKREDKEGKKDGQTGKERRRSRHKR